MIDIVTENIPNLKNIRQIGSPTETDKIYIEAAAYERIHLEEFPEKRVFVLMGHTECREGCYATFIEAAIAVREIAFDKSTPVWTNHVWNDVFREVRQSYENSVIVGWAVDIKGMPPKMTEELESVHREQFGGVHQLVLLMDSLEQEEYFYQLRNNHLRQRDGFYIYYDPNTAQQPEQGSVPEYYMAADRAERRRTVEERQAVGERESADANQKKARYRELYCNASKTEKQPDSGKKLTAYAMTAAIALLVAIIGTGIYQNRISLPGFDHVLETITSGAKAAGEESIQEDRQAETEAEQTMLEASETEEPDSSKAVDTAAIPVEEISGGTVVGSGTADSQQDDDVVQTAVEDQSVQQDEETLTPTYYTVKKGDTLLQICRSIYGSADRLEEIETLNGLTDADEIYEGQQLILPQ